MAISAPVLGGYTLAVPATYEIEFEYRGGSIELANGDVGWDIIGGQKRIFRLSWNMLTAAQLATVQSAFAAIASASASYTQPEGGAAVTVKRSPGQKTLKVQYVIAAGGPRYSTALELREV